jgi:RNA polymerase sigma factor (sigma-70 family)
LIRLKLTVCGGRPRILSAINTRHRDSGAGVDHEHVSLDASGALLTERSSDFVSLDDALTALAQRAPRKAQVVERRFFGGLSVEETAEVVHVSSSTVMREWKSAKAWLRRELTATTANGPQALASGR